MAAALSVEIFTKYLTPYLVHAYAMLSVPKTLVVIAVTGDRSRRGRCLCEQHDKQYLD